MAIDERDFYASHGIRFDIEKMQIEYTKRVIRQAKIEVLTELQSEIEEKHREEEFMNDWNNGYNSCLVDDYNSIQQKINSLRGGENEGM